MQCAVKLFSISDINSTRWGELWDLLASNANLCYYAVFRRKNCLDWAWENVAGNVITAAYYVMPLLYNVCVSVTWRDVDGVSAVGTTSIDFVEPGVNFNGRYSQEVLLCKYFCQIFVSCQNFTCFAHRACETMLTMETPDFIPHALTATQPRLKSSGLQSVVSNVGEGLQRADQGRRWIAWTDSISWQLGQTLWERCWYDSQTVMPCTRKEAKGGHSEHKLSQ